MAGGQGATPAPPLTRADVNLAMRRTVEELLELSNTKGNEYCRGNVDNAWQNFEETAQEAGLDKPEQAWLVLFAKHFLSVKYWVKYGEVKSDETIRGRLKDMIVYLFLLLARVDHETEAAVKQEVARQELSVDDLPVTVAPVEPFCSQCQRPVSVFQAERRTVNGIVLYFHQYCVDRWEASFIGGGPVLTRRPPQD